MYVQDIWIIGSQLYNQKKKKNPPFHSSRELSG